MLQHFGAVVPIPARSAEVLEANHVAAKVRSLLYATNGAQRIFEIRVNLHLIHKAQCNFLKLRCVETVTFFVNLDVLISTNAAVTALMYERVLLKVTLPDPMGYLYLSVSMPACHQMLVKLCSPSIKNRLQNQNTF